MAGVKPSGKIWEKQKRFCDEYLLHANGTRAAIAAGYTERTAAQMAYQLLTYTHIQEYIEKANSKVAKKLEITRERVLAEYAKLAFYDIRNLHDESGNLIPIKELDDESAAAIAGLEVFEEKERAGEETIVTGYTKKVKLADKRAALDSICKVMGYNAAERHAIEGAEGGPIAVKHTVEFKEYAGK